ncbi:MAG: hypothetical protein ACI9P7_000676 [Candidatus Azotimanducaceae bacterium]|jgi:hypothetical protein
MIHKIKALYDNGNASSMRAISVQLGISRNTVRKYLRQDEVTTAHQQEEFQGGISGHPLSVNALNAIQARANLTPAPVFTQMSRSTGSVAEPHNPPLLILYCTATFARLRAPPVASQHHLLTIGITTLRDLSHGHFNRCKVFECLS